MGFHLKKALKILSASLMVFSVLACGNNPDNLPAPAQQPGIAGGGLVTILQGASGLGPNGLSPNSVQIPVGQSVTWNDQDDGPAHQMVSDTGAFDTGPMLVDDKVTIPFTTAGTFPYHDKNFPTITGVVIVQ